MAQVLVVDDDRMLAETVADILAMEGHTVRVGKDGIDGMRLVAEQLPDLLVLDLEMPRLSGPEMARRMAIEGGGRERIPIVLLSGVADVDLVGALIGTPYVLTKPCDLDMLIDTTRRALSEKTAPQPPEGILKKV